MNQWCEPKKEPLYIAYIHKQNDDGTYQVYWPQKGWSDPMNKIPEHIYDEFEEISEQEAFLEVL